MTPIADMRSLEILQCSGLGAVTCYCSGRGQEEPQRSVPIYDDSALVQGHAIGLG
jgi:hypothetical protein